MEVSKFGCGEADECSCAACLAQIPGLLPVEPVQQSLPGFKTIPLRHADIPQYTCVRTFVFENGEFLCKCETEEAAERVRDAMSGAAANDYNAHLLASLR
jgi:hypothetical protein